MDHSTIPEIQSLEELYTVRGIAEILGVAPSLVTSWRKDYDMPYIRLGKHAFFSKTQVVAFLNDYQKNVPDKVAILGRQLAAKSLSARRNREKK